MQAPVGKFVSRRTFFVSALLFLVTAALFWPVTQFEFVGYDDPFYVTQNPHVQSGLTLDNVAWAFSQVAGQATYWHPLSWISHMIDCQFFGLKSGAHHLVSALFHAVNVILVFFLLQKLTGAFWRSAAVAGLFALHPLQVESVAWVTERKNLLSTFFFLLTLLAYARFVRKNQSGCEKSCAAENESDASEVPAACPIQSAISRLTTPEYILVFLLFALGLMSKPMLVTIPCVLLLLDFWPLQRFASSPKEKGKFFLSLVVEKIPLFVLSGISSWITIVAHEKLQYVASQNIPFSIRLANCALSYLRYIEKAIWPNDLAAIYPYPTSWPATQVITAALLLLAATALFWTLRRSQPFLLFGWCWFLGTLIPVIGLLQVGAQAMADRFVYVPIIGLFIIATWGVAELFSRLPQGKMAGLLTATVALVACFAGSQHQLPFWKDSFALFDRALAITPNNVVAHYNMGLALSLVRKNAEARKHYEEALRLSPTYIDARNNLAGGLFEEERYGEAAIEYKKVLDASPNHPLALFNLGVVYEKSGDLKTAESFFQKLTQSHPDYFPGWKKLADLAGQQGRLSDVNEIRASMLKANPDSGSAHLTAGELYMAQQKVPEALDEFQKAVVLDPKNASAHYNAANALGLTGRTTEAVAHLKEAVQLDPHFAEAYYTLGMAAAHDGKVEDAVSNYKHAIEAQPQFVPALVNLSWILVSHQSDKVRNGSEALQLASRAVESTRGKDASALQALAAAYAETGKFPQAIETAEKAVSVAETSGNPDQLKQLYSHLELYRQKRPIHGL